MDKLDKKSYEVLKFYYGKDIVEYGKDPDWKIVDYLRYNKFLDSYKNSNGIVYKLKISNDGKLAVEEYELEMEKLTLQKKAVEIAEKANSKSTVANVISIISIFIAVCSIVFPILINYFIK